MRRPMVTALAVLLFGTLLLPGCFYYAGPLWWYPDYDEHWERHHEWRERHGALTPRHEEQGQRNDHARRGHDNNDAG